MGSKFSRAVHGYMARNERRLLLVGLDNAGKSTVLQYARKLAKKTADNQPTAPTEQFTVETFKHNGLVMHLWDVGGRDKLRPYWRHYYTGSQGILFVVDASDQERIDAAASELRTLSADDQLVDVAIVVLANKADLPGALTAEQLAQRLDCARVLAAHPYTVQACTASAGRGLPEVFDFLAQHTKPL